MSDQLEVGKSLVCFCTRSKRGGHVFCNRCFHMLTADAQYALTHAQRRDFPAIYDRCVAQLQGARRAPSPRYKARGASAQRSWFDADPA